MSTTRTRIFWTTRELQLLAAEVRKTHPYPASNGFVPAVEAAQKVVLPLERQRCMTSRQHAKALIEYMQAHPERPAEEKDYGSTQKVEWRTPEHLSAAATTPTVEAEPPRTEQPSTVAPSIPVSLDSLLEALAATMAERFIFHLRGALASVADREVAEFLHHEPGKHHGEHKHHPKAEGRLPKVLVVGLKPGQAAMINEEFGRKFSLSFLDSDKSPGSVKEKLGNADAVFLMKFADHGHWHTMQKNSAVSPTFIPGGMSALRQALESYKPKAH